MFLDLLNLLRRARKVGFRREMVKGTFYVLVLDDHTFKRMFPTRSNYIAGT
jgi:truncated hemoglobin YjbI